MYNEIEGLQINIFNGDNNMINYIKNIIYHFLLILFLYISLCIFLIVYTFHQFLLLMV